MPLEYSSLSAPKERSFKVNGICLRAQEWGSEDGLPVIALHGWLDNCASFFDVAPRLHGLHIISLDMAGHGQSDHRLGQGAYSFWDDIQDITTLADILGWPEFFLLGHSRGAIMSALTAATFPQRVRGAALIEGLIPEPVAEVNAPQHLATALSALKYQLNRPRNYYQNFSDAVKARARGLFPLSETAAHELAARGVRSDAQGYYWASDSRLLAPSPIKLTQQQLDVFVNAISSPVQLLLATEGLPKIYSGYLDALKKYPHINYQILEGGHHLHMEGKAQLVAELLQDFFAQFQSR